MSSSPAPIALPLHLALLSIISFGGIPSVLPDIHNYVVAANGWLSDREFANFFAIAQALPGPNMILMMSLIGWRIGGLSTAIASALAIFGPPCAMYYLAYRMWDRFRDATWQRIARRGLVPVTIGLIIGGGTVMARTADTNWETTIVTVVAATLILGMRANPLWILIAAATAGALGLLRCPTLAITWTNRRMNSIRRIRDRNTGTTTISRCVDNPVQLSTALLGTARPPSYRVSVNS